jgi:hypothetical protein
MVEIDWQRWLEIVRNPLLEMEEAGKLQKEYVKTK